MVGFVCFWEYTDLTNEEAISMRETVDGKKNKSTQQIVILREQFCSQSLCRPLPFPPHHAEIILRMQKEEKKK